MVHLSEKVNAHSHLKSPSHAFDPLPVYNTVNYKI